MEMSSPKKEYIVLISGLLGFSIGFTKVNPCADYGLKGLKHRKCGTGHRDLVKGKERLMLRLSSQGSSSSVEYSLGSACLYSSFRLKLARVHRP